MRFSAIKEIDGCFRSVFMAEETWDGDYDEQTGEFVENPHYRPEFDVELSDGHAAMVLEALGFHIEDGCFEADINVFLDAAHSWLRRHIGKPSAAVEQTTSRWPGRGTWTDVGVREGYCNEKILQLVVLAQAGKERGATRISGA